MTEHSLGRGSAVRSAYVHDHRQLPIRRTAAGSLSSDELYLKLLMAALFLPEGLSFFVGDFRLSAARVLLIILSITAASRLSRRINTSNFVFVPSDMMALAAGIWMVLAAVATGGFAGLKGAGIAAIEFTCAYFVFRILLGPVNSSVRLIQFSCKLMVLAVVVALLDPLTGKLFTYDFVKGITGYTIAGLEGPLVALNTAVFRNGLVRAMGPFEHSILFGAICIWFGSLALITFPSRLFGWSIAGLALIGVWFSQARGPLLAYIIACALALFYIVAKRFPARWTVLGSFVGVGLAVIITFVRNPLARIVTLGGLIDPQTGWYRQAIWNAAGALVLQSPLFGIGLTGNWDWRASRALISASVDAFWLRAAMMFGIPGSLLIFLTMAAAFWLGSVDGSRYLSREEKLLSVALGIVITSAVFLGFTVHYWGTCWILLGIFPAIRANLAEAAILRHRAVRAVGPRRG